MTGWLLDTNVVSELRKQRPDRHVKAWADEQAADSLFLSSVTAYGCEIRNSSSKKQTDPGVPAPEPWASWRASMTIELAITLL